MKKKLKGLYQVTAVSTNYIIMKLSLLHVTDIHFTAKSDYVTKVMPFCNAVVSSMRGTQKLYLIISGDIAYSGLKEEYAIAKKFLSNVKFYLTQEIKGLEIKYIIIPGNHDCDVINLETQLRKNVVSNMNYQMIGNDDSVISECLKVQNDFWDFYSYYNPIPSDKLFYLISDEVAGQKINFYCFNTAWTSQKHESPGSIFFPVKRYKQESYAACDWSFGVWHHPYNWFNPSTPENNKKEFEQFTEVLSNTHFFGHEHEQSNYNVENKNSDRKINLLSGELFHDDNKPKLSGFQLLSIDILSGEGNLKSFSYSLDHKLYVPKEKSLSLIKEAKNKYDISDVFVNDIDNIKIPLTVQNRKVIKLTDLFVFPDLDSERSLSTLFDSYTSSARLLDDDYGNCIIDGEGQIGKTSLLSHLFISFYQQGFSPILLSGKDIKEPTLDKYVKRIFRNQYHNEKDYESFYQSDKKSKILLIDDFQDSGLNNKTATTFFDDASNKFIKIIVTIEATSSFLPSMKAEFSNFKFYTIKPFGYKRRNDLVERYFNLKPDFLRNHEQERLTIVKNAYESIQSILGDKFIPSYPVFILSILQALDYKPMQNETSFGYCYQTLIHYSLNKAGIDNDEIDTYFNVLTELAYEFLKQDTESLSERYLNKFFSDYQIRYICPSYERVISTLKTSKILYEEDGEFSFGYSYILYYLSAKKISEILNTKDGQDRVNKLFSELHIERNANILVFVTHHSKDSSFIEKSIFNTMIALENCTPVTLEKKDPFYQSIESFSEELVKNVLETNRNPRRERDKDLIEQDNQNLTNSIDKQSASDSFKEISDVTISFHQAFRSIEIVGQIIKNRKGSMQIPDLRNMITEVFTTGFRTLSYMHNLLESSKEEIIKFISEESEITDSKYVIERKISKFIQFNNFQVCIGMFIKLTHSVGVKELRHIYNEVADSINTPAAQLVAFGINSYYGTISEKELTKLYNNLKDNQVALSILRSRVKSYVYNRELDFRTKQRLAGILKMTIDVPKSLISGKV